MTDFLGGPEDNDFFVTNIGGNVFVDGGDGYDRLIIDWSDGIGTELSWAGPQFEAGFVFFGWWNETFLSVKNVEFIDFRLTSNNDMVELFGSAPIAFDGRGGIDIFSGDFSSSLKPIVFEANETPDAVSVFVGQGTELKNVERIWVSGSQWNDRIKAGSYDDMLYGHGGDDRLIGGAGDDIIDGGVGDDYLAGGEGNDRYINPEDGDIIVENADEGIDTVDTQADHYVLKANVENLVFRDDGIFTGTGNELDNFMQVLDYSSTAKLNGMAGADILFSLDGDDILDGGSGADFMQGGYGNDRYIVDNVGDVVVEQAGQGFDTVDTSISYTLTENVESLRLIGITGAVDAHGNDGKNWLNAVWVDVAPAAGTMIRLFGEGGNDDLQGSRFDDRLDGGTGADRMTGGFGNDRYVVDNVGDMVIEKAGEGFDTVDTSISYTLTANVESLRLIGITGAVDAHGNDGKNWLNAVWVDVAPAAGTMIRLYGEGGDDNLLGSRYGDRLDGGTGADTMTGGGGNDRYVVDNVGDVVIEKAGEGFDTVDTSISYTLTANVESLRLIGITGAVDAHGNAGNNWLNAAWVDVAPAAGTMIRLFGEGGNDNLLGSRYGDLLDGGAGSDMLTGGAGNDRFHFGDVLDAATNVDTILDFQKGDVIELDDAIFSALSAGALDAGQFVANADGVATSADNRIIYDTDSSQLFYDADGSLGGAAILFGVVAGHPPLTGADFVVV
ncbi:type I secretion protein [Sphingobium sp. C100]|uniref:calcium-binding protein n=1 Tax=Sphingobium sp. C100 TaxID=1207055 RepID=UPI0003D683C4|nr:calcium-binding protein [Sphingobium sp. C100]ETI65343.1 type I secretion protein [Sphingobium sp. C100]